MTKLIVRLRDGDATDQERWLLDSAAHDVPPPSAREHTLAMLGFAASAVPVVPGVLATTAKATSSGGAAASAGAASSAKTAGSVAGFSVLKWLGTGALVGAVAAGSVAAITTPGLVVTRSASSSRGTNAPLPSKTSVELGHRLVETEPGVAAPLRPVDDIPSAASAPPRVLPDRGVTAVPPGPALGAVAPRPAENANSVVEQVHALDRARAALAAGDPRAALGRLAENEHAFPGGVLEPEAVVLRVRALLDLGQRARAIATAEQFLAEQPGTPEGARLKALIGSAPP